MKKRARFFFSGILVASAVILGPAPGARAECITQRNCEVLTHQCESPPSIIYDPQDDDCDPL